MKMESNFFKKEIKKPDYENNQGPVNSVKFTPDGNYILCASKTYIEIWDIKSVNQVKKIEATKKPFIWVYDVVISPDGQFIIGGTDNITVWEYSSGNLVWQTETLVGLISKIDVSLDGKYIVGVTRQPSVIYIWDLENGELINRFKSYGNYSTVAFSLDNNYMFYTKGEKSISIWEIASRTDIKEFSSKKLGRVWSLAFTPNMKNVITASANKLIGIWDISEGELVNTLKGHKGMVISIAITSNGKYIISGSNDQTIKVWELFSGQLTHTLTGHIAPVVSIALSPDEKYIASGSMDNTIKLWNIPY